MIRFTKEDGTSIKTAPVPATVAAVEAKADAPTQQLQPSPPPAGPPLELSSDLPPSKPSRRRAAAPKKSSRAEVVYAGADPLMLNLDR